MLEWQVYKRKDNGKIYDAVIVTEQNISLLRDYVWGKDVPYKLSNIDVEIGEVYARGIEGYCFSYPVEHFEKHFEKVELSSEDLALWRNIPIPWRKDGKELQAILDDAKQFCSIDGMNCDLAFVRYTNYCGAVIYVEYPVKDDSDTIKCLNVEKKQIMSVNKSVLELGEFARDLTHTNTVWLSPGETSVCEIPENTTEIICVGDVCINGYIKMSSSYMTVKGDSLIINNPDRSTPIIGTTEHKVTAISIQTKEFKYYPEDREFWYKEIDELLPIITIRRD